MYQNNFCLSLYNTKTNGIIFINKLKRNPHFTNNFQKNKTSHSEVFLKFLLILGRKTRNGVSFWWKFRPTACSFAKKEAPSQLFFCELYKKFKTVARMCSTKNFAKFTWKNLRRSLFFNNAASPVQMFSCQFCKTFQSSFFTEHQLLTIASEWN